MKLACAMLVLGIAGRAVAQPSSGVPDDTEPVVVEAKPEEGWGTYEPGFGRGFNVGETKIASLNISGYSLFRFINQLGNDTFIDHNGVEQIVNRRRDLEFHRALIYLNGWFYDKKLTYNTTVWAILSTQQVNVIGSLSYAFHPAFRLVAGVYGLPGTRSLQNVWPYFNASDRVLADDFFRPGFTSGIWATGYPFKSLGYTVMLGNGLSQVGVKANQLTRNFAKSGSIWWMPTTGEFGDRGGFGDWEMHEELATRFGTSFTQSRENAQNELAPPSPDNTSIRLSDSQNAFAPGAITPGVQLLNADYWLWAVDAGFKLRGFNLQGEFYYRWLNRFDATGPLPLSQIVDKGFYVQASYFAIKRRLALYGITSFIDGQFNNSWEAGGGANGYPFDTRNFRLNAQVDYVSQTAASSLFGYYVGGQTGTTISLGADILF